MRYFLFLLIGLTFHVRLSAQTDTDLLAKAQAEAILMMDAFAKGDYDTFLDRLPAKVISLSGGREAMKNTFAKGIAPNMKVGASTVKTPTALIREGSTLQCALEHRQEMEINGQLMFTDGYLIGLSRDGGTHWEFISVSGGTLEKVRETFPEVSAKLDVKPQTYPRPVTK